MDTVQPWWSADGLNAYRIFPRLFSGLYAYLLWDAAQWYMSLVEPSPEQQWFASAMVAAAAAWFKFYTDSGKTK